MRRVWNMILAAGLVASLTVSAFAADKSVDDMSLDELKEAYIQLESENEALKAENDSLKEQLDPEAEDSTESDGALVAVDGDQQMELLDAEFFTAGTGQKAIRVNVKFTNNSSDGLYGLECFVAKAFQNDTEIENLTDYAINEDPSEGNGANMIKRILEHHSACFHCHRRVVRLVPRQL